MKALARWTLVLILLALTGCRGEGQTVQGGDEAPLLSLAPDSPERRVEVGETLTIQLLGADPQGDSLTFSFDAVVANSIEGTLAQASLFPSGNQATFVWSPEPVDVTQAAPTKLIFTATNSKNFSSERVVNVVVVPGNGVPRFTSPANARYKDCCDEPLTVSVEVRDDDSEQVTLSMVSGPPGSEFDQTQAKRGSFRWRPDGIPATRVIKAVFEAEDGVSPPVQHELSILITPKREREEEVETIQAIEVDGVCPTTPLLTHEPLKTSREPVPLFPVSVTLSDEALAKYEAIFLFPAWGDPGDQESFGTPLEGVEMMLEGNIATGTMPNMALETGQDVTMLYEFCLLDSDDPSLEGVVCVPESPAVFYSFGAYNSSDAPCVDDELDQLPDEDQHDDFLTYARRDLELQDTWFHYRVCPGDPDHHAITARPGQTIKVIVAHELGASMPEIKLYDASLEEITEQLESFECGVGYRYIEIEQPLSASPQNYYVAIEGAEQSSYFINSYELEAGRGCLDEVIEPNDQRSQAVPLRLGERRGGYELCPDERDVDVFSVDLEAGQTFSLFMYYNTDEADMFFELYEPSARDLFDQDFDGDYAVEISQISAEGDAITFDVRECGEHLIRVQTGQTAVPYELESSVSESACQDEDEFSDQCNHSFESPARNAIISFVERLELCPGSNDWYEVRGGFSQVRYDLYTLEAMGVSTENITLELWNPRTGERVAESVTAEEGNFGERLELKYTFPDNDIFLLRVFSTRPEKLVYDLDVTDLNAPL